MRWERTITAWLLATGLACGGITVAVAQTVEHPPAIPEDGEGKSGPRPAPTRPVSPWKQADTRPEHAILLELVGQFTTRVHIFDDTIVRAKDSEGTAEVKLLMGGLFVEVTHSESRNKHPFEQRMLYGFDTATRQYTAASIAQHSSAIVRYVGTYDAAKKQLTMTSRYSEPGGGGKLTVARAVTTFVDAKTWNYDEFISRGSGGNEIQTVSMVFTRR